jgi:hypothetical protein
VTHEVRRTCEADRCRMFPLFYDKQNRHWEQKQRKWCIDIHPSKTTSFTSRSTKLHLDLKRSRQIFGRQYVIQTVISFVPAQANTLAFITLYNKWKINFLVH